MSCLVLVIVIYLETTPYTYHIYKRSRMLYYIFRLGQVILTSSHHILAAHAVASDDMMIKSSNSKGMIGEKKDHHHHDQLQLIVRNPQKE